ncbi:hypothetical protein YC2023_120928 [Brassica napus]
METKNQDEALFRLFRNTELTNHFTVPPIGLAGGLSLSWKEDIQVDILFSSANIIDTRIEAHGTFSFVSFIYGAPHSADRPAFWKTLMELGEGRDESWLITGDFNDLLDNSEKVGGPVRWEGSFLSFRNFVSQMGLWDLKHSGNHLSWRGTRYTHFIQSRLDRAMANCSWFEKFPAGRSEYLRFEGSDHRPIVVHFDVSRKRRKGLFRFDRRLVNKPEIRQLVAEHWTKEPLDSVLTKIAKIRYNIILWCREQNRNSNIAIRKAQDDLEEALSSPSPDPAGIVALTATLESAYKEEELYWRQRSRILWLHSGDRNTGFFHASTRGRRACNKISVLENRDGKAVYREDEIVQEITGYYSQIFEAKLSDSSLVVQEGISPTVTAEMNQTLIAPPTREEIKEALFSIHADKAPGPDGFSAGFYQSYWDILGGDVTKDIQNFFETGSLEARQNETHVRLIPKILGARRVAEYRPIALCNTHYKIIAKLLTRRLQPLLPGLISDYQSAFVKGRSISDNVLITHEILHYLQHSGATIRCSMAIKTDMSKAYDRIEWSFLRNVLERFGFHNMWISWIMECVTSVSYSYLVNGAAQGRVTPSRGIRQGDPLSPYLFILCTEVLSGLCMKAQQKGEIIGVKVSRNSPAISHLLFADDTMFFTRTDARSCSALISILQRYEKASGQCINFDKSSITFSAKTPGDSKRRIREQFRISNEGGLGKYLGLPEHFGRKKRDIFAALVDRIRQKSHSWTTRFLSGAGKMVLLKSVLAAMPSYSMSCFKLPNSLVKQLQSILTRFWWDLSPGIKKMCWVAWDKLTYPKSAGGLGFREIAQFNDALLAKISWRVLKNPTSLLAQILLGKYCNRSAFLETPGSSGMSHGWRGILIGRDLLLKGLGWALGSGDSVGIWNEPWLSTATPISPIGPPTFENQSWTVSKLIDPVSKEWNIDIIRETLPHYEEEICSLFPSYFQLDDELMWLNSASGTYTTKSGYAVAKLWNGNASNQEFNWRKWVWQVQTTPKIRHFLWKANSKALPVGTLLESRGLATSPVCKRCGARETELHVLLHCPFAERVWELMPCLHKPSASTITSVAQLLQHCGRMISLPPVGLGNTPLYPWILWILWTNRNKLTFENRLFSEENTILKAIKDARAWKAAQTCVEMPSIPHSVVPNFSPPVTNSYTWSSFSDAAWTSSSGNCGLGWYLRDATNTCTENSSSHRRYVPSALVAEALAVKAALTAAVSSHVSCLNVFSDSKALILLLKSQGKDVIMKGILHDIRILALSFESISFFFIPRVANSVADSLAKSALYSLPSPVPATE